MNTTTADTVIESFVKKVGLKKLGIFVLCLLLPASLIFVLTSSEDKKDSSQSWAHPKSKSFSINHKATNKSSTTGGWGNTTYGNAQSKASIKKVDLAVNSLSKPASSPRKNFNLPSNSQSPNLGGYGLGAMLIYGSGNGYGNLKDDFRYPDGGGYYNDPGDNDPGPGWGGGGGGYSGGSSISHWVDISMSDDGKYLTAVDRAGYICTSSDRGVTWVSAGTAKDWSATTMLGQGVPRQFATVNGGNIYTSRDGGKTWTATAEIQNWMDICESSNSLVAVASQGRIYISGDLGDNWLPTGSIQNYSAVTSSDGFIATTIANGYINVSYDGGETWGLTASDSVRNWSAIDSAGSLAVASATGGYLYLSQDSCQTWNPLINLGVRDWSGVSSSADGKCITASVAGGYLYTSFDGGINWRAVDSARSWSSVKVSSTGQIQAATVSGGAVYMSTDYGMSWTEKVVNSQLGWRDPSPSAAPLGSIPTPTIHPVVNPPIPGGH